MSLLSPGPPGAHVSTEPRAIVGIADAMARVSVMEKIESFMLSR